MDPLELAEFLAPDDGSVPIAPGFKEALRERLWEIVREEVARPAQVRPGATRRDDGSADGD